MIASHFVMTLRVVVGAPSHQSTIVSVPSYAAFQVRSQPNRSYGGPTADGAANGRSDRRHHSSVASDEPAVLDQRRFRKEEGPARFAEAPLLV